MITAEGFVHAFTRTAYFMHNHTKDLTHADALVQPPAPGNCILWIVGHVACYRNHILRMLGEAPTLDDAHAARFVPNSAPVLGEEPGLARFEDLLAAYDRSQEPIFAALRTLPPDAAAEVITLGSQTMPRAELVMSLMRHESYHIGQLELLREIALQGRA